MSRELWVVEPCPTCGGSGECKCRGEFHVCAPPPFGLCVTCGHSGVDTRSVDFDAIWTRYYATANRRFEAGLTYDELKQVVLGGTE